MSPLALEARSQLLRLARMAIESALLRRSLDPVTPEGELAAKRGVFVTLTHHRLLRGCIGQIEPVDPLAHAVVYCAVAAATEDPRFPPVIVEELQDIEIELSLLTPPCAVRPPEIEIGVHGLLISRGKQRGLLLPQVADEKNWPVERFLEETCLKAGLDAAAWRDPETRIEAFSADIFSERDVNAALHRGAAGR
jgi:AmmeMemoRadiSam system protein A